jgi:hypothetical protein
MITSNEVLVRLDGAALFALTPAVVTVMVLSGSATKENILNYLIGAYAQLVDGKRLEDDHE